MTLRRCLRCGERWPEQQMREAGQGWYCAVPCLRCGRLLLHSEAVRDPSGAGYYHERCAGRWCYKRERHNALMALHQGGELVRGGGLGRWSATDPGWCRPARREGEQPARVCGGAVMEELRRDGIVIRLGDRRILAPHLRET